MDSSQSERQEPMGSAVEWRAADKSILSALPPKNSEPWEHGHIGQSFYWGVMLTQAKLCRLSNLSLLSPLSVFNVEE